jgi:hypothetical protein
LTFSIGCAEQRYVPRPDGDCIQLTKRKQSFATQYWVNQWPVADSDVNPLLEDEPASRPQFKRAMWMRGFGYAILGLSVLSIPTGAVALTLEHHGDQSAYGAIPGVAGLAVASGLIVGGWRHTERAIAAYNHNAAVTERCVAPGQSAEEIAATEGSFPPIVKGGLVATENVLAEGSALTSHRATLMTSALTIKEPGREANGITVAVAAVGPADLKERASLVQRIEWAEQEASMGTDRGALTRGAGPISTANPGSSVHSGRVLLVPLPAIALRVENRSGHPINFSSAQVRLEDALGHKYPAFSTAGGIWHRVQNDFIRSHPDLGTSLSMRDNIRILVEQMQVLLPQIQVADGQAWTGYVGFRIALHNASEIDAFVQRVEGLKLVIANLDGNDFSYELDKVKVPLAVVCAEGSAPTLANCAPETLQ